MIETFVEQEIVDLFDSNLEFIGIVDYRYPHVYRVDYRGWDGILKWGHKFSFEIQGEKSAWAQVKRESRALALAEGMSGIPELYEVYGSVNEYFALLKEFIPGQDFEDCEFSFDRETRLRIHDGIANISLELESLGIHNKDLRKSNVVITPYFKPYIVDLGYVEFEDCDEELDDISDLIL